MTTVEDERAQQRSDLVVTDGSRRQVLYSWPEGLSDQAARLVWAGDLDRDGKLDYYLVLSSHYNLAEHTLFLSSRAKLGQIVGAAAVFKLSGC